MTLFDAMADPARHDAFHSELPDLDAAGAENVAGRGGCVRGGLPPQIPAQMTSRAPTLG